MDDRSTTRRELLALFAALGAATTTTQAQDPVKVAPRNYRVAFENERVRVLEYYSRPGVGVCGQGRHYHPAHLTLALTDGKARVLLDDGRVIVAENKAGDMFWAPAETHTTENIGKNEARAYIVEIKDAAWKPSTWSEGAKAG
jgi:quercetin dioxygenase-like cupin family protein